MSQGLLVISLSPGEPQSFPGSTDITSCICHHYPLPGLTLESPEMPVILAGAAVLIPGNGLITCPPLLPGAWAPSIVLWSLAGCQALNPKVTFFPVLAQKKVLPLRWTFFPIPPHNDQTLKGIVNDCFLLAE